MLFWSKTLNFSFFLSLPRNRIPRGSVNGDCNEDSTLCAALNVRAAEEGPESTNLRCRFPDPRGAFELVSKVA